MATTADPKQKQTDDQQGSSEPNKSGNTSPVLGMGWWLHGMVVTNPEQTDRQYEGKPKEYILQFQVSDGTSTHQIVIVDEVEAQLPALQFGDKIKLSIVKLQHNQYTGFKLISKIAD